MHFSFPNDSSSFFDINDSLNRKNSEIISPIFLPRMTKREKAKVDEVRTPKTIDSLGLELIVLLNGG